MFKLTDKQFIMQETACMYSLFMWYFVSWKLLKIKKKNYPSCSYILSSKTMGVQNYGLLAHTLKKIVCHSCILIGWWLQGMDVFSFSFLLFLSFRKLEYPLSLVFPLVHLQPLNGNFYQRFLVTLPDCGSEVLLLFMLPHRFKNITYFSTFTFWGGEKKGHWTNTRH